MMSSCVGQTGRGTHFDYNNQTCPPDADNVAAVHNAHDVVAAVRVVVVVVVAAAALLGLHSYSHRQAGRKHPCRENSQACMHC